MRAVRARRLRRASTSPATRSPGTATSSRRSRPFVVVTDTCIVSALHLETRAVRAVWCERRDSNFLGLPHWLLRPARLPFRHFRAPKTYEPGHGKRWEE